MQAFAIAADRARRALDENRTVAAIVLEEGLLTEARLNECCGSKP